MSAFIIVKLLFCFLLSYILFLIFFLLVSLFVLLCSLLFSPLYHTRGFILIRKTDFSQQFVRNVLRHHRCDGCRDKFCFDFSAGYDQGCIDNLLSHEYRDQLHHFGVGRVQAPVARTKQLAYNPGSLLFCHPAGLVKTFYDDPCNLFANDDGLHVRRRRKT